MEFDGFSESDSLATGRVPGNLIKQLRFGKSSRKLSISNSRKSSVRPLKIGDSNNFRIKLMTEAIVSRSKF